VKNILNRIKIYSVESEEYSGVKNILNRINIYSVESEEYPDQGNGLIFEKRRIF
jgi:hypothetical protein